MYLEASRSRTLATRADLGSEEKDATETLVPTLLSISKMTRAMLGIELAAIGLYQGQDELIMALEGSEPVPVSTLADKLCVRPSTVSKMLDRLQAKNLIERMPSQKDARLTLVRATPAGIATKRAIAKLWARIEEGLIGKMGDRKSGALAADLSLLDTTLKGRLARLR